ncbi:hypothetical protein [Blastococcus capsensis]|uniref:hypothetical protein n=1 Tax=Blastococcus capsensis TaxID=1564163 RepID=UPI0025401039|nr:hypothetical protein [Blastococcus capsensis]MDK3257017.1 hypothetical protein [Blastococcus capsensis]
MTYEISGKREDLDAAVMAGRKSVSATGAHDPNRPLRQSNLAFALRLRFERLGDPADIVEAAELALQAAKCAAGSPMLPRLQSNLGVTLRVRFTVSGDVEDLRGAIAWAKKSLRSAPPQDPDRVGMLANLGLALLEASIESGRDELLREAVTVMRDVMTATSEGDEDRSMYAQNLADALRVTAERTRTSADADAAVVAASEALDLVPPGHPSMTASLSDLGRAHRVRFEISSDPSDAERAIDLRRRAAVTVGGPATSRALAARAWGEWAAVDGQQEEAGRGYTYAVGLLPQVAWHGLDRSARERHMSLWRGLAQDAAATATNGGDPGLAVAVLEQGRAVIWSQSLLPSGLLTALREVSPHLAQRVEEVRAALDASTMASSVSQE